MKVRLQPHSVCPDGAVTWGPWWVVLNGVREQLGDRLSGWDYQADLAFELQPSFDVDSVLESTGLDSLDDIAIVLLLDCPAVGERWNSAYLLGDYLASDRSSLEVSASIGHLADAVKLSAHLVLWERRDSGNGSATRPGSRLAWSDVDTVQLEGHGSRFPTEEVSFKALGLEHAAWTIRTSFTDLNETFMSTVRLLINSDHRAADLLLEESPQQPLVQSALRMDIARQLFLHVASEPTMFGTEVGEWDEGSVGAVLNELTTTFMRMDLASTAKLARTDSSRFERKVQEGFDYLENS